MKIRRIITVILTFAIIVSVWAVTIKAAEENDSDYYYNGENIYLTSPENDKSDSIDYYVNAETEHYEIKAIVYKYKEVRDTDIDITDKSTEESWTISFYATYSMGIRRCYEDKNGDIVLIFDWGRRAFPVYVIDVSERAHYKCDYNNSFNAATDVYYDRIKGELWACYGHSIWNIHTKEAIKIPYIPYPDNFIEGRFDMTHSLYVSEKGEFFFSVSDVDGNTGNYVMAKNANGDYEVILLESPETGTPIIPLAITSAAALAVVIYKKRKIF